MTVDSTNNKDTYTGNTSTTVFAYTFRILADADILVQLKDSAGTDIPVDQTITTDYTVSGAGDQSGGNITFVTAPIATDTIILTRTVELKQGTDYVENDSFPAETHEEALDELTMIAQQQDEKIVRSLKIDAAISGFDTTIPTPVASKYITINSANDGLALADDTSDLGPLSKADGNFYVGDGTGIVAESGATARTSMGVSIGSSVQAWDAQLDDIAALAFTNGNIIVGDGSNWVAESGATARTSLGLTIGTNVQAWDTQLDDIAALAITDGNIIVGDGANWVAESGATARTSLGLTIGTNVQAWDTQLDDIAALAVTDGNFIVGDGSNWVAEIPATALVSIGGIGAATTDTLTEKTIDANASGNVITNIGSSEVNSEMITGQTGATAVAADGFIFTDVGDSSNLKTSTLQDIINLSTGASGLVKISDSTASSSASIVFTGLSSIYVKYVIEITDMVSANDNVTIRMKTSTDNGVSYDEGASDYKWAFSVSLEGATIASAGDNADTSITIGTQLGTGTGETFNGTIALYNVAGTNYTYMIADYAQIDQVPDLRRGFASGARLSAADVDAVEFTLSSGNIASGKFTLYGVTA